METNRLRGEVESVRNAEQAAVRTLSASLEETKRLLAEEKNKSDLFCSDLATSLKEKDDLVSKKHNYVACPKC
jgi:hypothetical protein